LEKGLRAITGLVGLTQPFFVGLGESVANFITPAANALGKLADQLSTIGTAGGQFKLDFGGIKALRLDDVFAFDIFGLSGYFNDQISNINLDLGRLHFGFLTSPDLTDVQFNIGDLLKTHFASTGETTLSRSRAPTPRRR
jgi:hypothetical protein